MQGQLLCTTVVGSYPQPEWLIDRQTLGRGMVPRVPARGLWRIPDESSPSHTAVVWSWVVSLPTLGSGTAKASFISPLAILGR